MLRIGRTASVWVAAALLLATMVVAASPTDAQEDAGSIRVVHGVSDLGPIDVYIDGRLAVVGAAFPSATVPLQLAGGDHRLSAVATGGALDSPLVDSVVSVEPGTSAEIALVGSAADMPAVLFPVDTSSLDADRARLRVVHGSPDAGPLDVSFVGGDAIFPTVEFLTASEYAELPAGAYTLDLRTPGSEVATIFLPELELAPGEVVDVYVIGQAADAGVQSLVVRTAVEVTPLVGLSASIRQGTCADPGAEVASIGIVAEPRGASVGGDSGAPVRNGFGSAPVAFDAAVAAPHAIVLGSSEAADSGIVACGTIAGALTDDGALAIPLRGADGASVGVAVVAPGVLDPSAIDVSVFVLPAAEPAAGQSDTSDAGNAAGSAGADDAVVVDVAPATPASDS